ncbi:MAG TPA: glycosyltransferase family 1 protein [Gemmataceae bacterium]
MRVVFNLLQTLKPKTGVGHYAARLFAALREQMPAEDLHGFPTGPLAVAVRRIQHARSGGTPQAGRSRLTVAMKDGLRAAGRGCLGLAFRAACRRGGYDLYHEPNFIPLAGGVPSVVTVHDLSVILQPQWHPSDRVRHHESRFRRGLSAARHVLTDTQAVRRQIIEHLGVAPDRVTAVHLGVGPEFFAADPSDSDRARRALGLPADYLLVVGTIEPRKNVPTLLRAYLNLPTGLRRRCPLVLAGGWGWNVDEAADLIRVDDSVLHLGYTPDDHLPGLYAGARALAFPSFYEGFGLPPLEMLAAGGAVISSTTAALHEVLGPRAHFIDPLDEAGWRHALARAITDDDWLRSLRDGGRAWAARFTWNRCAAETSAVYRSILSPARRAA